MTEPAITPELIASHGLKPDEYQRLLGIIGREPSFTELGIFSAMWNEHCSYKSSKKWLRTLPTTGPQVICGPGENAGVVDIGDGQAGLRPGATAGASLGRRRSGWSGTRCIPATATTASGEQGDRDAQCQAVHASESHRAPSRKFYAPTAPPGVMRGS